ncbi:hypothetical protein BH20ACI4_BH20ACI4_09410 [soil metagenome]
MIWNTKINFKNDIHIAIFTKLLSISAILNLSFVITLQVSAQMGSGVTYSDTWIESSVTGNSVIGSGVTDESYNTYNHEAWVNVTLSNSSGQTATANAGQQGGGGYGTFARADAVLPLTETDEFFNVESEHGYFCAIAFRDTILGTTFVTADVVLHSYRRELPSGDYVPTCCSPCTIVPRYRAIGVSASYIQCTSFTIQGRGCTAPAVCVNSPVEAACRPNTGRQPPLCE